MDKLSAASSARVTLRTRITPARVYAVTRITLGAWLFVAPDAFGHKWFAAPQDHLLTASLIRSIGGRDFGMGAGLVLASAPRPWLWLCAFCDLLDAGMVLLARSRFSETDVVMGVVGASLYALIGIAIALFGVRKPSQAPGAFGKQV